jgi:hypothetical protein
MAPSPLPPPSEKRPPRSLFELPSDFFDSSVLLRAHPSTAPSAVEPSEPSRPPPTQQQHQQLSEAAGSRWTCNTCASEFESLQEQREHFKSDLHRLNVSICALSLHLSTSDRFFYSLLIDFWNFSIDTVSRAPPDILFSRQRPSTDHSWNYLVDGTLSYQMFACR